MKKLSKIAVFIIACVVMLNIACGEKNVAIPVEEIILDTMSLTLVRDYPGFNSYQLKATIVPENATNQKIIWISNDRDVATVSDNGLVTAGEVGEAKIYASSEDGGFRTACMVLVNNKPIPVTGISFDFTRLDGPDFFINGEVKIDQYTGFTLLPYVKFDPVDATDQYLSWVSDDATIAKIGERGYLDGLLPGKTIIRTMARGSDNGQYGREATCVVEVIKAALYVSDVALEPSTVELQIGEGATQDKLTATLTASLTPADADDQTIEWESSNPSVVTVASTGALTALATAKSIGSATITVTAKGGRAGAEFKKTASVNVSRYYPPHVMPVPAGADLETVILENTDKSEFWLLGSQYSVPFKNSADADMAFSRSVILKGASESGRSQILMKGRSLQIGNNANIDYLLFENIDFVGNGSGGYVFNTSNYACTLQLITFRNCTFEGIQRSIYRVQGADHVTNALVIDNCVVKNMASNADGYYLIVNSTAGCIGKITITNSTFANLNNAGIVRMETYTGKIELTISGCTFYGISISSTATDALFRFTNAQNSVFVLTNNIFGKTNSTTNRAIFQNHTTATFTGSADNYRTSDCSVTNPAAALGFTLYSNNSDALFTSPAAFDFSIQDTGFAGFGTAGDPRWW